MSARLSRLLHLFHRWLGISAGLLVLGWFVSGLVMLYSPFPRLTAEERVQHLEVLHGEAVRISPAEAAAQCPGTPRGVRLAMLAGRPVYHFSGGKPACSVWADDGRWVGPVSAEMALEAARRFLPGVTLAEPDRIERDQWSVYSSYNAHRPLYRIAADDAAGTVLYVSSKSGEVLADTNRRERLLGWLGSVPHWIYFTPLRGDDLGTWRVLVLWLPPIALLTAVAGLALGIQRVRVRRRYPRGQITPYHGWKRWHHLAGLAVGSFAITWLLSGWLSNHPFGLLEMSSPPPGSAQRLAGGPFRPSADLDLLRRQLAQVPDAREAEWYRFGGRDYLEVRTLAGPRRLDDQAHVAAPIDVATLAAAVEAIEHRPVAHAELIDREDLYHYGRSSPAVLPAARIRLADAQDTTWYLDPATGRILQRIDDANRWHRWVFNALHRLDFPPLASLPGLREGLITLLCLLGASLAGSGCVIGWRRLFRRRRPPA